MANKTQKHRNTVNRSISFDPDLFALMEDRREALRMQRSEYLTRLIMEDMCKHKGCLAASMEITAIPADILPRGTARERTQKSSRR